MIRRNCNRCAESFAFESVIYYAQKQGNQIHGISHHLFFFSFSHCLSHSLSLTLHRREQIMKRKKNAFKHQNFCLFVCTNNTELVQKSKCNSKSSERCRKEKIVFVQLCGLRILFVQSRKKNSQRQRDPENQKSCIWLKGK